MSGYGENCIEINNILVRNQPVILLPGLFLLWNVTKPEDITMDSLAVITTFCPTIEVLCIGCGSKVPRRLPMELLQAMRKKGVIVEFSTTPKAASTFNVLKAEGRGVAAALIPADKFEY